jgi:hypothetical protein
MTSTAASQIAARDFGRKAIAALARKGIRIIGIQALPDMSSSMPFANANRGYTIDDNGCGRVWTYQQVAKEIAA